MKPLSIAIIDHLGIPYDGRTVDIQGLGGSESATTFISRELVKLGFEVTVYNNCDGKNIRNGTYDGVEYESLTILNHLKINLDYDIVIVSRSVIPFVDPKYTPILKNAKLKILWTHDTFVQGDERVEDLLINGVIDEWFTLSDFQTLYMLTAFHGRRRNPEVLKNKIFQTRNGVKRYFSEGVDVNLKDQNLFVYNASVTKGMVPLVERIWPLIKKFIPEAKLTVIGGYYKFKDGDAPDAQEQKWRELSNDPALKALDIEFTGIIPQLEIAAILTKAKFFLYPGAFPETSGISTLEALTYNVIPITTRFGALEETAIDLASYKIDYAIEPNSLFTDINTETQIRKFVEMAVHAHGSTYLNMQKQQYCNIIHDVYGWDTVALQWKQHFFRSLRLYLPIEEYRTVSKINHRVHEVFGRRFNNPEELQVPRADPQQKIVIIVPFYNAEAFIERCIRSIAAQDYNGYVVHLIDDCSTDGGAQIAIDTIASLPFSVRQHFGIIQRNVERVGALANQVSILRSYGRPEIFIERDVVDGIGNLIMMLIDGDDSLINDPNIFHRYNNLYYDGAEFTYGSCWSMVDNIPLIAQPYPVSVKEHKSYRRHRFVWNMPYSHIRTFRNRLMWWIPDSVLKDVDGNFMRAGGDTALFYNVLEQANPNKVVAVPDVIYNYNDAHPANDYKLYPLEQTANAEHVLNQRSIL